MAPTVPRCHIDVRVGEGGFRRCPGAPLDGLSRPPPHTVQGSTLRVTTAPAAMMPPRPMHIRNPPDVMRAAEDVSAIYHLAAAFRVASQPDSFYRDVNVRGTAHVVAAAQTHRVKRMIHCWTIDVHGNVKEIPSTESSPFNPGEETKLEGELVARAAIDRGLPGVIVRRPDLWPWRPALS